MAFKKPQKKKYGQNCLQCNSCANRKVWGLFRDLSSITPLYFILFGCCVVVGFLRQLPKHAEACVEAHCRRSESLCKMTMKNSHFRQCDLVRVGQWLTSKSNGIHDVPIKSVLWPHAVINSEQTHTSQRALQYRSEPQNTFNAYRTTRKNKCVKVSLRTCGAHNFFLLLTPLQRIISAEISKRKKVFTFSKNSRHFTGRTFLDQTEPELIDKYDPRFFFLQKVQCGSQPFPEASA